MWVVIRTYTVPDIDDGELTVVEPVCILQIAEGKGFNPSVVLRDIANRLGIDHHELHASTCDVVTV